MRSRFLIIFVITASTAFGFFATETAEAQLPHARLYSIFPLGAQAGTTAEISVVNGADIDELNALHFSDPGIRATQKMKAGLPVNNTFVVSVDEHVRPGIHEVRTAGLFGVSNPRAFVVGTQGETSEVATNATAEKAMPIAINTAVNGRINKATEVDFYAFDGKKDQRLFVEVLAKRIDSKLAAAIELSGPDGRRIVKSRSTDQQDPQFGIVLPGDGRYTLKVYDSAYRGGATYGYRLRVHTEPHIDFVLPNSGVAGTRSKFTIYGRNLGGEVSTHLVDGLPLEKLVVDITLPHNTATLTGTDIRSQRAGVDGFEWTYKNSNPVLIQLCNHTPMVEVEPNNDGSKAQRVSVPCSIAGQFGARNDKDYFEFEIKEARTKSLFIEVFGHRSGSSVDPVLIVEHVTKSDKGVESVKKLSSLDDGKNPGGNNFQLSTRDPVYELKAARPGIYRVIVHDRYFESRGDCRLTYRLAIRDPKPDFRVVVFPATTPAANSPGGTSGLTLRKGDNLPIEVLVLRRDGFNEPVTIEADGLPTGITAGTAMISAGQSSAKLILSAAPDAPETFANIRIVGKTKQLTRIARAATITWTGNQNEANQARLTTTIALSVMKDEQRFQPIADARRFEVNQSRQILIPVELLKRAGFDEKVTFAFTGQPKNVDVENKAIEKSKSNGVFRMFVKPNAKEGTHLVYLNATGAVSYGRNPWKVARETEAQTIAVAAAAAADTEIQKWTAELAASKQATEQLDTGLKANIVAKQTADKSVVMTAAAVTAMQRQSEVAATAVAATQKVLQSTQASLKSINEQVVSPEIESLKQALQTAATTAETAFNQAAMSQKSMQAKLVAATSAHQAAIKTAAATTTKAATSDQVLKLQRKRHAVIEEALKTAQTLKKAADTSKAAANKRVVDAIKAAKPKSINVTVPSTPFLLTIRKAPIRLTAAVPNSGNLKRGEKLDIKVTVKREAGFTGPVHVKLPLPPGVADLTAPGVDIAADKTEGILVVTAGPNATEGQLANMVVQAEMDFNGKAAVDAPIAVKVAK